MNEITKEDIRKLRNDPLSFAVLMENQYLEHVIATFVSVLNKRRRMRGDQN